MGSRTGENGGSTAALVAAVVATAAVVLATRWCVTHFALVVGLALAALALAALPSRPLLERFAALSRDELLDPARGGIERLSALPAYAKDALGGGLDRLLAAMKPKSDGSQDMVAVDASAIDCKAEPAMCARKVETLVMPGAATGSSRPKQVERVEVDPARLDALKRELVKLKALFDYMQRRPALAAALEARLPPPEAPEA